MKKFFTLAAVAAAFAASAQVIVLPEFEEEIELGKTSTLAAETVIVDDANIKAVTTFEATCGATECDFTITDASLGTYTNWIQVRVAKDPSEAYPNGEQQSGSTSIIFSPKVDMTLSAFVRTGDNKSMVLTNKADFTKVEGSSKGEAEQNGNNCWIWTYSLKANNEYVLTERGGTGRFYGFQYTVAGGDAVESISVIDENAPIYNAQGVRVNADAKGLLIQNGKKIIRK